jgi:predicted dehydrogenase
LEKILNWGILSTARINRALIKPLAASNRTQLLAVASRDPFTGEAYAREWKIPKAYGDYESLLIDPEIDVIYNPLPNHLHAEWTVKALNAGKHVLCEKPLGLTLEEVDSMIKASRHNNKVLAEGLMYRHHAQTLRVKQIVQNGDLGKVQFIRGSFSFKLNREGDYRNFKHMGGGSLWDIGIYPISYARMIVGEDPEEVFGWQVQGAGGCDISFAGQMKFPNGVICQFDSSFESPFHTSMEIVGTSATLFVPKPFKPGKSNTLLIRREDEEKSTTIDGGDLYLGEVEDMVSSILEEKPPRVTLQDSRGNIAAILALLDSAEKRRPVSVKERSG